MMESCKLGYHRGMLWELTDEGINPVDQTTFSQERLKERQDLQRLLRENIEVLSPHTLVIAEEYGQWTDSRRRIDLLAIDANANLVVIELKRNETGSLMELQAVRYAAMVSTMTFAQAVDTFQRYLQRLGRDEDAEKLILDFLEWEEPEEEHFASDVRIVLASADFSMELTTAVMWLNQRSLDIRCVRLKPYTLGGRILLDVQQVLPLPEAEAYQIRVREKAEETRQARRFNPDLTKFNVMINGAVISNLAKRWVMHTIIAAALRADATPEQIHDALPGARKRVIVMNGELTSELFQERLAELRTRRGKPFSPRRYFLADSELIHHGGRTFAISNQWGGPKFLNNVHAMIDRFPNLNIAYAAVPIE